MTFFQKLFRISLLSMFLLVISIFGIAWWAALPSLKQLDEYLASGSLQVTPHKQLWILATYDTKELAVHGFLNAYQRTDPRGWHSLSRKLASTFVFLFRDILHTKEEWAAIYCTTTSCLDQWSEKAYNRSFDELNEAEAGCAMQLSISYFRFKECDPASGGDIKE